MIYAFNKVGHFIRHIGMVYMGSKKISNLYNLPQGVTVNQYTWTKIVDEDHLVLWQEFSDVLAK